MLHELYLLDAACRAAYAKHDFCQVTRRVLEFVTTTLSSVYLDAVKDTLYAGYGARRDAVVSVVDAILGTTTSIIAPVLPHLAEDIHWYRGGAERDPKDPSEVTSFFRTGWKRVDERWYSESVAQTAAELLALRAEVYALVARCREDGCVHANRLVRNEAQVEVELRGSYAHAADLEALCGVARVYVASPSEPDAPWVRAGERVRVRPARADKCPRCWRHTREAADELCDRCAHVVAM